MTVLDMIQLNNADQLSSYQRMAEEIWHQTSGQISAFIRGRPQVEHSTARLSRLRIT
jgi:hypothetical protein